jgi:hypothetical protein
MQEHELDVLLKKPPPVANAYFCENSGWYGRLYRWPYEAGIYSYAYNITRLTNDCGTAIFNSPEGAYRKFSEKETVLFLAQLCMLTGVGNEEARRIIFTTNNDNIYQSLKDNEDIKNFNITVDIIQTYKAHYGVKSFYVTVIGIHSSVRDILVEKYKTIVREDWKRLANKTKAVIIHLLRTGDHFRGRHDQGKTNFDILELLEKTQAELLKPEPTKSRKKKSIADSFLDEL